MKKSFPQAREWHEFHDQRLEEGNYPKWPNEAMLKVLFGSYLKHPVHPSSDWKVLDVGCGFGNNLLPFLEKGCECYGVEIDKGIAKLCAPILAKRGYSASITAGSNRNIPHEDSTFNLVLTVNTLHYEGSEKNILAALNEFKRVLRPGGTLYISTVGPRHEIYRRAEPLGNHRYRICNYDFRNGQEFFFFDNERYLEYYCKQVFGDVEVGFVTEHLMTLPIDFLIAISRKT